MIVIILRLVIVALLSAAFEANAQVDTILSRYRQYLIASVKPESDPAQALATQTASHQWPDLNYNDTARAFWQILNHIKRVRDLALVWASPGTPLYNRDDVRQAIHNGLEHWLAHRYKNSNWWHNEIGVPQYMRDIIVLFQKELSSSELKGALEVLAQYKIQKSGAGANLTWTADLAFHYGALTGNDALMNESRQLIVDEVESSIGEGIQPDFSYHQHGPRLQEYHYGSAFLKSNIRIAWQFRGTKWSFPKEKIQLLIDFVLNGWQWMARGIYTVPGTIDRACSRRNTLINADLRDLLPYLSQLSSEHANEFNAMLLRQNGTGDALVGFRYYPYSDFSVYQQKDFTFLLKTISTRTLASESINDENLKGYLLNSGDGYIIRNGSEYFNLMPAWDWNLLPGISSFAGARKIIKNDFTGGVSDSITGLTAMEYGLQGDDGKMMRLRKSWFCHGGVVVCLIANLDSNNKFENVLTALDQCRWQSEVSFSGQSTPLSEGHHQLNNIKWMHHQGVGYIFLSPGTVQVDLKQVTGTWRSINASETDSPVTEKVFLPVLMHEQRKNLGYVLVGGKSAQETRALVEKPTWKIVSNNKNCQAVGFDDGTVIISFYSAGGLKYDRHYLTVDQPCLLLIKRNRFYFSNPKHTGIKLKARYDQSNLSIQLPDNGYTTGIELPVRN